MSDYIFIDINGTMIPDGSLGLDMPMDDLELLQNWFKKLADTNIRLGFCSDSPLDQMIEMSIRLKLGDTIPFFAENGNIFAEGAYKRVLSALPEGMKKVIYSSAHEIADKMRLSQVDEIVAPEFCGSKTDFSDCWGFGANRKASISIFGSPRFILELGEKLSNQFLMNGKEIGLDISPEYNYLGIHPTRDFTQGKSLAMKWLYEDHQPLHGPIESIWMIGDSPSDLIEIDNPMARSCFVSTDKLNSEQRNEAFYISEFKYLVGVNDCLSAITHRLDLRTKREL